MGPSDSGQLSFQGLEGHQEKPLLHSDPEGLTS